MQAMVRAQSSRTLDQINAPCRAVQNYMRHNHSMANIISRASQNTSLRIDAIQESVKFKKVAKLRDGKAYIAFAWVLAHWHPMRYVKLAMQAMVRAQSSRTLDQMNAPCRAVQNYM